MSQSLPEASVIYPSPEFPVEWETASDAELFWIQLQGYYPKPVTPMGFTLLHKPTAKVGNQSLEKLNVPLKQITRHINGYVYSALIIPKDQTEIKEISPIQLNEMITGLKDQWESVWLPKVNKHLVWWNNFDHQEADLPTLITHFEETKQHIDQIEIIHLDLVRASLVAINLFQKMVKDLLTDEETIDVHAFLVGFETKGTKSTQVLWDLSRYALSETDVSEIILNNSSINVINRLSYSKMGQVFLTKFNTFLEEYGYQGNKNYVNEPTLPENPSLAIQIIQGYMNQPERNLKAQTQALITQREQALKIIRKQLIYYPTSVVKHFEFLLQAAQEGTWLREQHAHLLDQPLNACIRKLLLRLGDALFKADILQEKKDIFYLTSDEISTILNTNSHTALQRLVEQRQKIENHYINIVPPLNFGTLPTTQPPQHPITDAIMQNLGSLHLPTMDSTPSELKGFAASSGQVRGIARIVNSETDIGKLQAEDILVVATIVPAWTPLFPNIAGLVSSTGGILSHAAIVAREFSIPAVVGVTRANLIIKEGQLIEIDGNTGIISLNLEALT